MLLNFARLYSDTVTNQNLWHLRLPMCQLLLNSTKSSTRNFSPFFLTFFRHARLPYYVILSKPLNLKEDSEVAGKLRIADRVLKLAMDNLNSHFQQNKIQADRSTMVPKIGEGSQLFVLTSQRNKISFKLAQKWTGPFICIKLLDNNNLLLKPVNGRKLISVHRNLCKLLPDRLEYLRFNDDNPFSALSPTNTTRDNNPIEPRPNSPTPDDYPGDDTVPNNPIAPDDVPNHPEGAPDPPTPPEPDGHPEAPDPPTPPEPQNTPQPPRLLPPTTQAPTSTVPRTRAAARAANISVPKPSFQPHTLEFELRKKRRKKGNC